MLALAILGLGLVSTGSRGGIVGTLAALGLTWWHSRGKLTSGLIIAAIIVVSAIILTTIVPVEAFTRSEGSGAIADADDRINTWQYALSYFLQKPIFGLGWGQLEPAVLRDTPYYARSVATTAHNSVIKLLTESGLVGTIPFVVLCWHVLRVLWRSARDKESSGPLHLGAFVAFSGMLLATMTSVYQFERYFWVPVAFAASLELTEKAQPAHSPQRNGVLPDRTLRVPH
jgi:O-antigen ligase